MKFYELTIEKQERFKMAGYKIFAESTYDKASMQSLADEAGISKALIFHYFKNKITLYHWLFEEAISTVNVMDKMVLKNGDDFFELIREVITKRFEVMHQYLLTYKFLERAYKEKLLIGSGEVLSRINDLADARKKRVLACVDTSKFINVNDIEMHYDLIIDLADGYYNRYLLNDVIKENDIDQFLVYLDSLRKHYYKEAYL